MFKLLVALFFIKHLTNVFTKNALFRGVNKELLKFMEEKNITTEDRVDKFKSDIVGYGCGVVVYSFGVFVFAIIGFVMILNMISYDPTIATKLYLGLIAIHTIVTIARTKIKKVKTKENPLEQQREFVENLESFNLYMFTTRLVSAIYWGYAVFILFF